MCDLERAAVAMLSAIPGIVVRESKIINVEKGEAGVRPRQISADIDAEQPQVGVIVPPHWLAQDPTVLQPVYAASQGSFFTRLFQMREAVTPPITGVGTTGIVIDTGIRKTHVGLRGKVVYEEDMTGGDNPDDVFDHGTGVAYLGAGGMHQPGQESGIAPGAVIMNLKAIGDLGVGTEEDVIQALGRSLELWQAAVDAELPIYDPARPNGINMSFGVEDDDDPDNPIRLAVEEIYATAAGDLGMYAAAGNDGPEPGTITLPASCPEVSATGAVTFDPFYIWEQSSRGPVPLGNLTKPDQVSVGVRILTASSVSDESFVVKTGTSFASPLTISFSALLNEFADRMGFRESFIQEMGLEQRAILQEAISAKPEGSPSGKDNTYGYGMVMGDLYLKVAGATGGLGDISGLMGSMMAVMMMTMMMKQV